MKKVILLFFIITTLFLVSCGGEDKEDWKKYQLYEQDTYGGLFEETIYISGEKWKTTEDGDAGSNTFKVDSSKTSNYVGFPFEMKTGEKLVYSGYYSYHFFYIKANGKKVFYSLNNETIPADFLDENAGKIGIEFKTLQYDESKDAYYLEVGSDVETFNFNNEITRIGDCQYGLDVAANMQLFNGENTAHLNYIDENGTSHRLTIIIYRKYTYSVKFMSDENTCVETIQVEAGQKATPSTVTPEKDYYIFDKWDFNFDTPITQDIEINAVFKPIDDLKDFIYKAYKDLWDRTQVEVIGLTNPEATELVIPSIVTILSSEEFTNNTVKKVTLAEGINTNRIYLSAFEALEEVILPNDLTEINGGLLSGCASLKTVTIPSTVVSIGNGAFYSCTSLTSLIIPENVASIEDYAFYGCTSLKKLTIPETVKEIKGNPFEKADLEKLTLSYKFKDQEFEIEAKTVKFDCGDAGYAGIMYLNNNNDIEFAVENIYVNDELINDTITIPNTVTKIGPRDIIHNKVTKIVLPATLTEIEADTFRQFTSLEEVVYAGDKNYVLEKIGESAFYQCPNLAKADIIQNVKVIERSAFANCPKLFFENFSDNLESIGNYAFSYCTSLKRVVIPESVKKIGERAFGSCSNVASIIMPTNNSTMDFAYNAFGFDSENLKDYYGNGNYVNSYVSKYLETAIITAGSVRGFENSKIKTVTIYSKVSGISQYAFRNCTQLEAVYFNGLNTGIKTIGKEAFYGCTSLQYIDFEDIEGIETIEISAFENCTSLPSIKLPQTVTTIGKNAFKNCSNATFVTLSDSVNTIGADAFVDCEKLEYVSFSNFNYSTKRWYDIEFENAYANPLANGCDLYRTISSTNSGKVEKVSLEPNPNEDLSVFTLVKAYAYYGCTSIKEIEIWGGSIKFKTGAFANCSNIEKITSTKVKSYEFEDQALDNVKPIIYEGYIDLLNQLNRSNIKEVVLYGKGTLKSLDALEKIEFKDLETISSLGGKNTLKEITFGTSVKEISNNFRQYKALETVYYNGTIEDWCNISINQYYCSPMYVAKNFYILDENGAVEHNGKKYTTLEELTIPESVTTINNNQFAGFANLKKLIIPNTVTYIGNNAFANCDGLVEITIPFIGNEAYETVADNQGTLPKIFISYELNEYTGGTSESINKSIKKVTVTGGYIVPQNAMRNMGVEEVILPNTINAFATYAFANCNYLKSISIPDLITTLPEGAFNYCYSLNSVYLNKVETIEAGAFAGCFNLIQITIPATVTSVDTNAFGNTWGASGKFVEVYNLATDVTISASSILATHTSLEEPSILINKNDFIFIDDENGLRLIGYVGNEKDITTPNFDNRNYKINDFAFSYLVNLEAITISKDVTEIGKSAFYSTSSLKTITISNTVTTIGRSAFSSCSATIIFEENTAMTKVSDFQFGGYKGSLIIIPEGVETIGNNAFASCQRFLEGVVLPSTLTAIYNSIFDSTYSDVHIYYMGENPYTNQITYIGTSNYKLTDAPWFYYTENGAEETATGRWFYFDDAGQVVELVIE